MLNLDTGRCGVNRTPGILLPKQATCHWPTHRKRSAHTGRPGVDRLAVRCTATGKFRTVTGPAPYLSSQTTLGQGVPLKGSLQYEFPPRQPQQLLFRKGLSAFLSSVAASDQKVAWLERYALGWNTRIELVTSILIGPRSAIELFPPRPSAPASIVRNACRYRRGLHHTSKNLRRTPGCPDDGLKTKRTSLLDALAPLCGTQTSVLLFSGRSNQKQKARSPVRSIRAFGLDLAVCRLGFIHLRQGEIPLGCVAHVSSSCHRSHTKTAAGWRHGD